MVSLQTGSIPVGWLLAWVTDLPPTMPSGRLVALYSGILLAGLVALVTLTVYLWPRGRSWPGKWARLRRRPWHLRDVGWLLATLLFLQAVAVLGLAALRHFAGGEADHLPFSWIVLHSLALHWACLPLVGMLLRRKGRSWSTAFCPAAQPSRGWAVAQGVWLYLATMPLLILLTAAYHWWLQSIGYTPVPQDVVRLFAQLDNRWMLTYFILLAVVVAPLAEEILFRGILLPALGKWCRAAGAIAVTTVIFALLHLHLPSLVPLALLSLVLSLAYIYTGSIIVPTVMHMVFNGVSLLAMWWLGGA